MIGLGRMGGNMTERLRRAGHEVLTYDPGVESTAGSLEELRDALAAPRAFWTMVPAGEVTENTFQQLLQLAEPGDTIVDGGNSNFRDSQRRYGEAKVRQIHFCDAGVSGGVWGLDNGYCLMVGGDDDGSSRSSGPWPPRTATRTSARPGRGTSRRWSTTGSSTG
jgi:6-phosphogluconate dehydrogenase